MSKFKQSETVIKEIPYFEGVCFDEDHNSIYGNYTDEISAFRARKNWKEALEINFGLEDDLDYLCIIDETEHHSYLLKLKFISASARYCFWKITNNRAPEVQYILETAHIPICETRYDEILKAPDLCSIEELENSLHSSKIKDYNRLSLALDKLVKDIYSEA